MAPIAVCDLDRAIDAGELDLVYQPEVDLRTGHIAAVEALVRWNHPVRGTVLPPAFIPLAERTGQIADVSAIVLRTALTQAGAWARSRWDGSALTVWVNLSACELADPHLHRRVMSALADSGVAADQLGLEITETAPITDDELAAVTLHAMHDEGVRIAIDDFGTGYSSLAHLKQLPIDVIKIDRSFVVGITDGGSDASIVASMTQMAHALRRVVIAEGVEHAAQQRALGDLGCDLGQGYLFANPQPAGSLTALLAADRQGAAFPTPTPAGHAVRLPRPRAATNLSDSQAPIARVD